MAEMENKIQQICDVLKNETIEPAKQEAKEIVENAKMQADEIIQHAREKAQEIAEKERVERDRQKKMFDASLELTCRQTIDALKAQIEKQFFHDNLRDLVVKATKPDDVIAKIVNALVVAAEKEGIDGDLKAYIAKTASKEEVNRQLLADVISKLKQKSVTLGDFAGGAKLELVDQKMTIDMSEEVVVALVAAYIRDDFREMLFNL